MGDARDESEGLKWMREGGCGGEGKGSVRVAGLGSRGMCVGVKLMRVKEGEGRSLRGKGVKKKDLRGCKEDGPHHSHLPPFTSPAVSILFKINSPHLRLLLDIFHLQHICGNITRNIDRLLPYTGA